ncbi:MAG: hypothetical protein Q8Q33_04545 [Chlamydiota bacterium]|nr:hypothetical protein [Chlamydiota bacterium]
MAAQKRKAEITDKIVALLDQAKKAACKLIEERQPTLFHEEALEVLPEPKEVNK